MTVASILIIGKIMNSLWASQIVGSIYSNKNMCGKSTRYPHFFRTLESNPNKCKLDFPSVNWPSK